MSPFLVRSLGALFLVGSLLPPSLIAADLPSARDLLRRMDELYRGKTSQGEMEMTVQTAHWTRVLRLKVWSEGMDKTFVVLLSPKKDAGIATLRVRNEMWNFFPRINKTLKVPPSMMMGSWMGSDFTNDDLVKESSLLEDYHARFTDEPGPPGSFAIELIPKAETPTVWARILLWVEPKGLLPLREDYFDEKGEKVRTLLFKEVKTMGGRTFPTVMELQPLRKPGHKTLVRYIDLRFDEPLPPSVFTLQNLRRER